MCTGIFLSNIALIIRPSEQEDCDVVSAVVGLAFLKHIILLALVLFRFYLDVQVHFQ